MFTNDKLTAVTLYPSLSRKNVWYSQLTHNVSSMRLNFKEVLTTDILMRFKLVCNLYDAIAICILLLGMITSLDRDESRIFSMYKN